jgi:hypothetical protein
MQAKTTCSTHTRDKESAQVSLLPANEFKSRSDNTGDWWRSHPEAVLLEQQPRTAVYRNEAGAIVIRQEDGSGACGDPFVTILPEHLPRILAALFRLAKPGA